MCIRARLPVWVGAILLVSVSSLWAQSTYFNPGSALATLKQAYGQARAAHAAAEQAVQAARDGEKTARSAYFRALDGDDAAFAAAIRERDAAKLALDGLIAQADALVLSPASESEAQRIIRRQNEITQILGALGNAATAQSAGLRAEYGELSKAYGRISAEKTRLAREKQAMEPRIDAARRVLEQAEERVSTASAGQPDRLTERTAWLTAELARKNAEKRERSARQAYLTALKAYRRLYALSPPPILAAVDIRVDGKLYYTASYDQIDIDEPAPSGGQLRYATTLADALAQVQKELEPMRRAIAERDKEREKIVLRLAPLQRRINETVEELRAAKIDAVLAPVAVEIGATVAEFIATGGVATGVRILAEKLTEETIRHTSKVITARVATKTAGDLAGAAIGKTGAFALMDKRGADATGNLKLGAFEAVVLSDIIELGLTETVPAMQGLHKLYRQPLTKTWSAISDGARALKGNLSLYKAAGSVNPGVPIAIIGTLTKAAVAEYYAQRVSALETQFYSDIAESSALIAMFDHFNQMDRALADLLTIYEAAEQDIFFRLFLADQSVRLELNRSTDEVFEFRRGTVSDVRIDLTFSAALQNPPKVTLHGIEARVTPGAGGEAGRVWRATLTLPETIGDDVKELQLSVSLNGQETSWTALDSVPETQLLPDIPNEDWRGYEAAPDTRHRLLLERWIPDFSGRWHGGGGEYGDLLNRYYVYRVVQDKDRLRMYYEDVPERITFLCNSPLNRSLGCIDLGQMFLDVRLSDDPETENMIEFEGKAWLRRRQAKCGVGEESTDVTLYGAPTGDVFRMEFKLIENRGANTECNFLRTGRLVNSIFFRLGTPAAQENLRLSRTGGSVFIGELSFYAPGFTPLDWQGGGGERAAFPNDGSSEFYLPFDIIGEAPEGYALPRLTPREARRLQAYRDGEIKNVPGFFPANPASFWKDMGIEPPAGLGETPSGLIAPVTGSEFTPFTVDPPAINPLAPIQPLEVQPLVIEPLPLPGEVSN